MNETIFINHAIREFHLETHKFNIRRPVIIRSKYVMFAVFNECHPMLWICEDFII